jgi:choline kinase
MSNSQVKVSVVIPSLDGYRQGNVPKLLACLKEQSFKDIEVIVIKGVRPNGKARNIGAQKAKGEFIVFIDDDVILGHERVIENLINTLQEDKTIGMCGSSQLIPLDSSAFQKRYALEMPRAVSPIVKVITESDMVTHMCMAISRELYFKVGMENENLIRGTDPDLRQRLRKVGYRIVIVPNTWAYHPAPENLLQSMRISFNKGVGSAWVFKYYPDLVYETPSHEMSKFVGRVSVGYRFVRHLSNLFKTVLSLKLILLTANLSYLVGYLIGLFKPKGRGANAKAIIIAAGMGSRLKPLTDEVPKCMLYFKGKTLLEHQLEVFKAYNIENIVVIKGYKQEKINYPGLTYYLNDNYKDNNILNSLFYAEGEIEGEVIISYSDILFEKKVLEKLLASDADIAIIVDMDWKENYKGRKYHPEEEAEKVILDANNNVLEIGKILLERLAVCGEFIGLMKLSPRGSEIFREHFRKVKTLYWGKPFQRAATFEKAYLTDMLQYMVEQHITVRGVIIRKGWIEIDTVEDFQRLRRDVKRV